MRLLLLGVLLLGFSCTNAARPEPTPQTTRVAESVELAQPAPVLPSVEPPKPAPVIHVAALSPINEANHLELRERSSSVPVDLGQGRKAYHFGTIFMKNSLSRATVPVRLHIRGVTAEPGSEAEIYFADQRGDFIPSALIGSITTASGGPGTIREIVLEVKDFEASGKKYNARTELRGMAHFGLVLVVLKGSVKVDEFILTTPPTEK